MAKVHDKFVVELAEVIKGYGNDPNVDDPFRLSEFYRFYELPEIAVSANHFKTMIPLEVEKAKGRKTCGLECLRCKQTYDYSWDTMDEISYTMYSYCPDCIRKGIQLLKSQDKEGVHEMTDKHTEERTETHACDCISRQAAIDALGGGAIR